MDAVNAFFGQEEEVESTAAEITFFTVSEVDGEVVVTLMGVPDLADPTWGVILD